MDEVPGLGMKRVLDRYRGAASRIAHGTGAEKRFTLARAIQAVVPVPLPTQTPWGSRWLARPDVIGQRVFAGDFERTEVQVARYLIHPGTVVLDVGANVGYYTLLASALVGTSGHVIAFEPSRRELRLLRLHLRMNRATNVEVVSAAVGSHEGNAQLTVVAGRETGLNSLRAAGVEGQDVTVPVVTIDSFLEYRRHGPAVSFMKIDVEGGELDVLRGAADLLRRDAPAIMCEVEEKRTTPWGYAAVEILQLLEDFGYRLFIPSENGRLVAANHSARGNIFALPEVSLPPLAHLLAE